MQKIGIITKPDRENLAPVLKDIVDYLKKKDKEVFIEDKVVNSINSVSKGKLSLQDKGYPIDEIVLSADMLIALGGDGTLLNAARLIGQKNNNIPLLGVNFGSLGFLTEATHDKIFSILDDFFDGKYRTEERMMLGIDVVPSVSEGKNFLAFNEIVICKNNPHRMIDIVVYIDNKYVNTFKADGLIVSTPTGSTAYSLSAGGPLLLPSLNAFVVTPICSHTLNNRSIVIPGDSEVEVKLGDGTNSGSVNLDGQVSIPFGCDNIVKIKKSPVAIKLVQLGDKDYYELWRRKLSWGRRE